MKIFILNNVPGILISSVAAIAAQIIYQIQIYFLNQAFLDTIVISLLIGIITRLIYGLKAIFIPGIVTTSKTILEFAVMLLGATITFEELNNLNYLFIFSIFTFVSVVLIMSYKISVIFRIPKKQSILIAVGNAICGNSAIAAISNIIKASPEDVMSTIAFTSVLSIFIVLLLPLLYFTFGFNEYEYGMIVGLSVYAVPQVLAATASVGTTSMQTAAVIKLLRVTMLGPILVSASLYNGLKQGNLKLLSIFPWFLIGFILLACLRIYGVIPDFLQNSIASVAKFITVISMAAIGFSISIYNVQRSAIGIAIAVSLSQALLILISIAFVRLK